MKTKIIPFDLETAKKIQAGEIKGKFVTSNNERARILCFDAKSDLFPIVVLVDNGVDELAYSISRHGHHTSQLFSLFIELSEETHEDFDMEEVPTGDGSIVFYRHVPKHEFKPFDKVLVREQSTDEWKCDYFSHAQNDGVCTYYVCIGGEFLKCIPCEGNQELIGTTDNPE